MTNPGTKLEWQLQARDPLKRGFLIAGAALSSSLERGFRSNGLTMRCAISTRPETVVCLEVSITTIDPIFF